MHIPQDCVSGIVAALLIERGIDYTLRFIKRRVWRKSVQLPDPAGSSTEIEPANDYGGGGRKAPPFSRTARLPFQRLGRHE
jgi:hypothetical protein